MARDDSKGRRRLATVFLPAMLCNGELYEQQIDAFSDLVEPLVLTVAEATMAEAARAVLRQAPPRFLMVGTSYGGNLALEVVATAPSRVAGLWLMGCVPGPPGDPDGGRLRNARVRRGEFDAIVNELATMIAHESGSHADEAVSAFRRMARRAGPAVFLRQNTSLLGRSDRRAGLACIGCPTLLVWGREDRFAPLSTGLEMSGLIRGAGLVVLDECGHLPTLEQPEATVALGREWLASLATKRA